jgi:hypothetical protein
VSFHTRPGLFVRKGSSSFSILQSWDHNWNVESAGDLHEQSCQLHVSLSVCEDKVNLFGVPLDVMTKMNESDQGRHGVRRSPVVDLFLLASIEVEPRLPPL